MVDIDTSKDAQEDRGSWEEMPAAIVKAKTRKYIEQIEARGDKASWDLLVHLRDYLLALRPEAARN